MSTVLHAESTYYENFIRRAHKCLRQSKLGAHSQLFLNLVNAENGKAMKHLGSFDFQLKEIKEYLSNAFDKFKKLNEEEAKKMQTLKDRLLVAKSTKAISEIILEALDATKRFK